MYFKFEGIIDCSKCANDIANFGYIKQETMLDILKNPQIRVTDFMVDAIIKRMEEREAIYKKLYPKMLLKEDWIDKDISDSEVEENFKKFFFPLGGDSCQVTIIDPYIFSSGTNSELLLNVIKENVKIKEIRFIRNESKVDTPIRNIVIRSLEDDGYRIEEINATELHDRWWYTRKAGFTVGISFNGISKKNSTIKMLDDFELNKIIAKYGI